MKTLFILFIFAYAMAFNLCKAQIPFANDLTVEDNTFNSGYIPYRNNTHIISPGSADKPLTVTASAQVEYVAGQSIHLKPGFSATGLSSTGYFRARIEPSIEVVLIEPNNSDFVVGKYDKLEVGLKLPENINALVKQYFCHAKAYLANPTGTYSDAGLNPFNPDAISIEATFTSPSSNTEKRYGFYYDEFLRNLSGSNWDTIPTDYNWRIRFTPDELGDWSFTVKMTATGFSPIEVTGLNFTCVDQDYKGYLEIGQDQRHLRFNETPETNKSFYAVGVNLAWFDEYPYTPQSGENYYNKIAEFANHGGNYIRLGMVPWSLRFEWKLLGFYNQTDAWELDRIFDAAEGWGVYIQLATEWTNPFNEYTECEADWNKSSWCNNPYKIISGINTPIDFFTSSAALAQYKKYLRYIVSRWGYSTHLAMYETFNEIDKAGTVTEHDSLGNDHEISGGIYNSNPTPFVDWATNIKKYIGNELGDRHPITVSFAKLPIETADTTLLDSAADIASIHSYDMTQENNLGRFLNSQSLNLRYPTIISEMANEIKPCYDACDRISFHNALWASSFMGNIGTSLFLYWNMIWGDNYHEDTWYDEFMPVNIFFQSVDFENKVYESQKWNYQDDAGARAEVFALVATDQDHVIGWMHDTAYWWYNYYNYNQCVQEIVDNQGCENMPLLVTNIHTNPVTHDNDEIKIEGLEAWWTDYDISFYNTHTGTFASAITESTGLFGTLTFNSPNIGLGGSDYAFKIVKSSLAKMLKTNDSAAVDIKQRKPETNLTAQNPSNKSEVLAFKKNQPINQNILINPNPCSGIFNIDIGQYPGDFSVVVYNMLGVSVFEKNNCCPSVLTVDLSKYDKGVYVVKVFKSDKVFISKIIYQ